MKMNCPVDVYTAPFSSPAKRILLRHKETDNYSDKYIKKIVCQNNRA